MAIKWVPDLGAPVAVTAVDLIIESTAPDYSKWATGIMAAGGYLGAAMGWGGDFVKNIGIAALPAAAKNIYDWAREGTSSKSVSRARFQRAPVSRPVTRYPAPLEEAPFNTGGGRLV
jgi:hypothetical protein